MNYSSISLIILNFDVIMTIEALNAISFSLLIDSFFYEKINVMTIENVFIGG